MTAAGDIAPSIQTSPVLHCDAAAFLHLNIAVTAGGVAVVGAGAGVMLGAYANGALYINGRFGSHSQGPIYFRSRCGGGIRRRSGIVSVGAVKGDHQGDAAGDCVSTAGQSTVREQHNLVLTVCRGIGVGLVQIVESHTAGLKNRAGCGNEHRLDGLIAVKVQRSRCVRGQIFAAGHAVPAEELIAGGRGRHQSIGHVGLLGFACFGCDLHTIHRIAAVLTGQEGSGGADIRNQR